MGISLGGIGKAPLTPTFKADAKKQQVKDENPISLNGERALLAKTTFFGGLALGAKLLWEIWGDDPAFLGEQLFDVSAKITKKRKGGLGMLLATTVALGASALGGFALLYTAFKAPEINYGAKINTFTKKNDMDVFVQSNKAESAIFTQLGEKAEGATAEERQELYKQYMLMQATPRATYAPSNLFNSNSAV